MNYDEALQEVIDILVDEGYSEEEAYSLANVILKRIEY